MLELNDIKKDYVSGSTTVSALKGINLRFRDCEFVSILGQSGCGKTTMLNIIGGLDKYTSGDLKINGVSTKNYKDRDWDSYRNHTIGFVFQSFNLIDELTVFENVELPLLYAGVSTRERVKRVNEALERMQIAHRTEHYPQQLSGGQQQRVAIARAIVTNPRIILADEPTGNLYSTNGNEVMSLLKELNRDGATVVMVTHSEENAREAERIIRMMDGYILTESKNTR